MTCQIVVLHVQSKRQKGKAALRAAHGWRHDFFIYFGRFLALPGRKSDFCVKASYSASAKYGVAHSMTDGKPLADVPFSC